MPSSFHTTHIELVSEHLLFSSGTIPSTLSLNPPTQLRRGPGDTDENISPVENLIFAILTKIHL